MIRKFISKNLIKNSFLLVGKFKEDKKIELEKEKYIIDNPNNETSTIYLGSKKDFDLNKLVDVLEFIVANKERSYQIDVDSFVTSKIKELDVIKNFIYTWYKFFGQSFNLKTTKEQIKLKYLLTNKEVSKFDDDILIASQMCEIRTLQDMAPNILTINKFTSYIKNLSTNNKSMKLTILEKSDLQKLGMNLILGVNAGSKENVKVMVLEYKGLPNSKQKITFVGKGIMFDSGGYNLKTPGKYMLDMKYDMSGAAISVILVDTLSKMRVKKNISCIVPLTDNMVDSLGQLPESIYTSMSGKTVEVANTDAEGRLILADAITYASKKMNSSLIIDLSTLTGTVIYALGRYTGAWSTKDSNWMLLEKSAKKVNELIWRMPIDDIYLETLTKDTFADTLSCSLTDRPDSNIAATWLNQFALGKEYIHLDIAGSADLNSKGQAPMFKTLIEFVKEYK